MRSQNCKLALTPNSKKSLRSILIHFKSLPEIEMYLPCSQDHNTGCRPEPDESSTHVRLLVGKPEAKRLLRKPRRRRVNNIKRDLVEMGWDEIN
jgi:hypothetical protein